MKKSSNLLKNPLNLILSILVVLSLLGAWLYAEEAPGIDYYVAWVAADAVKNDSPHDIYKPISQYKLAVIYRNKADELKDAPRQKSAARQQQELYISATPFMYWIIGVFSTGDYETDLDIWHALSIFLLTASILATCRLLGYSMATSLAVLLPLIVWFIPLHSDLRVANVNSFQLGIIGLIFWLLSRGRNRRYIFVVGLVTGLLVMFKPNIAPVALLLAGGWLVRRQFAELLTGLSGMAAAAVTTMLVSSWWLGSATAWFDWLKVVRGIVELTYKESMGNVTIMSELSGGMSSEKQLFLALILSFLCLVFFWWGRRGEPASAGDQADESREVFENILLFSVGCIVTMLASGVVWLHYYLLTIPMLLFAFRPIQAPGRMKNLPVLMLRVLPAIALVCLLDTVITRLVGVDGLTYSRVTAMTSILILFVAGLWQLGYGVSDQRHLKAIEAPAAR